jgi:hypothetical protein
MSCILSLLRNLFPEIEHELKTGLQSGKGPDIEEFLPQFWVFETENETVSLMINAQGKAYAQTGEVPNRDLTIRWKHDVLALVLRSGNRASVSRDAHPEVIIHKPEGQAAFDFLRGRLGL